MPPVILPAASGDAHRAQAPEVDLAARRELLANAAELRRTRSPPLDTANAGAPDRGAALTWDSRFAVYRTPAQQANFAAWLEAWRAKGKGEEDADETADPMVLSKSQEFATGPPNHQSDDAAVSPFAAGAVASAPLQDAALVLDRQRHGEDIESQFAATAILLNTPAIVTRKTKTRAAAGGERELNKFDVVSIAPGDPIRIGRKRWYAIQGASGEYVRADHVLVGAIAPGVLGGASLAGTAGAASAPLDLAAAATTAADDPALEAWRAQALELARWQAAHPNVDPLTYTGPDRPPPGPSTAHTQAEGALWMMSGIFGMAAGARDLFDDEKSVWERVNSAFGFMGSSAAVIGSSAQIASTHISGESDPAGYANASGFGAWGLGYQEMFAGLQAALRTIRAVVELVRLIADAERQGEAWARTSGELLAGALETSKGVLRSIRQINETLSGSVSAEFAAALPGLDIAILAVKSITQGYYLVVSAVSWHAMKDREAALGGQVEGHVRGADAQGKARQVKMARHQFRRREARIAQLEKLVHEKEAKILREQARRQRTRKQSRIDDIDRRIARMEEKRRRYQSQLQSEVQALELDDQLAGLAGEGLTREGLAELDLAHMLRITNRKRVVRQSLHISTNLVQVGASIAALVSGPGAPAAIALKATAAGVDMSLPFLRWLKQQGRESAARAAAKGESSAAGLIFNADKATAAKLADRRKQAVTLLTLVVRLNQLRDDQAALQARGAQVEAFLIASGVDTEALYARNGRPAEQVDLLVAALCKRELGD